ncbi:hypothetical protein PACTADRAFT_49459 [Pachysolen tannophilus NRRL Y-2460]|uniref:Uncharacterized protein n=1 Tax=Pachysolen tannophilus NRRL Y-2460 TaxID=669874 RepID=A0A1E4TWB0_PACTA|nr:hypothetical protein PACTADRAFT_49459 [Pachysolen tannophilus NRRL Y-2460]
MLSGISVNQVFRPQSLLEEVVKIENLIKRKKYNAEKLLIVIQDLNILFGMVAYHSYSESHALASEIFMKLRKLAQIDHVSIIVSDTVQLKGKSFQIFSKRFYDYLLLLDHEGESVKISIDDVNDNLRYFNRDDNNRIDLKEEEQLVIIAQIQEFWEFLPSTISTDESAINIAKN